MIELIPQNDPSESSSFIPARIQGYDSLQLTKSPVGDKLPSEEVIAEQTGLAGPQYGKHWRPEKAKL